MSSSSFAGPMRLLGPQKSKALRALYSFCRDVDDIADGPLKPQEKQMQLEAWRDRLRTAQALPQNLLSAIEQYALPLELFDRIIDAMLMDVHGQMLWPEEQTLQTYCDGAAGAVGLLAIRIFGTSHDSEPFALALGQILQRINILRDVAEDAQRGRIYLPREWISEPVGSEAIAINPSLVKDTIWCMDHDISERIAALNAPKKDRVKLLPALAMLGIYERLSIKMRCDDYRYEAPYRLSRYQRFHGMLRGLLRFA